MKVKMSFSPVVCYFLLFILLDVAVKSQMSSNSNSHTFLQTNDDVRYIVESIPIPVHKEFSSSSSSGANVQSNEESTIYNPKAHVKFEPPLLDFKERPFGVPHQEKVFIVNRDANKTIHLNSISGNSVHFHSSFFEDKLLLPLTNTSFSVVFLGHEEGQVDTSLFIHTSDGSFKYQVRGSSVQSPYRLRPLAGVRLPLNASFNPLIYMHNPYGTPLQLVEVYSSGGEFHLELPSGELEGPKNLWEIPAFLTKPVIRVRFHARAQKNHTAYIRLKVNHSEEVLVVPLEVEVGGACGLYCPEDVVDFGIGGSLDPPSTRTLALHNSWKKPIKIQNVISTPVSKALRIDFQPVNVPPETNRPVTVASLTFDWAEALKSGQTSGRIVVKSKQSNQKLVIPYQATVLQGGLDYDQATTRFRSDEAAEPRIFTITNNFQLPVVITKVNLSSDATPYFELKEFEPKIVEPGRSADLFRLVPSLPHRLTLDATIHIHTNVSTLGVPLLCFDGKLVMVISRRNETELELGTVGSGTEKQVVFALVNRNPVPVRITGWLTSLPNATVSIVSVKGGDVHSFLANHTLHNETSDDRVLGPTQFAVIRALVKAGSQVGETMAHVIVHTEYETMEVPCHMRVEHGSLQVTPDPIVFKNCFPGKVCTESMRVQSLFSVAMAVTAVSAVPPDPRLSFSPSSPPLLLPAATTDIGTLSFDTDLLDQEDNYLTSSLNDTGATRWQDTLELPAHCLDYDLSLLASRYNHYFNVSSRLVNLTLRLDTTEVREHMLLARVMLRWPLLARDVAFPLTQVGNTTSRLLTIHNPGTRHPVTVQLVLESTYLSAAPVIENLPSQLRPEVIPGAQSVPGEFIIDAAESPHRAAGPHIHRGTWVFVLPPETNTTVRVFYKPSGAHLSSALLLLRSNLTVLETVQLSGTGAFAQFKFGNRKPGSTTPLLFDLAEKHLKDCEREKQRKLPTPNLTVKRSFTARNTGPLPISVHGFQISGIPCEGYGFRVLNCEPFQLAPNSTRKVDIAFTPDFTLARVQRTLAVLTSESPTAANYTLVATLPPFLLSTCSVVLARPAWEPLLYYCAITFMVFLLVCVLAAAFLESDRALKCALLAMSRDNAAPVQPVLDLKSIGTGVGLQGGVGTLPPLSADKSEMQPSSISWSKPPPNPPSPTAHESEAVKEKLLKSEVDGGIVGAKCTKRKEKEKEREKTAGGKRSSEPPNTNSWPTVFKPSAVVKPQPKPVSPPDPEQSKAACETTKRKLTKKTSNLSRCTRELTSLPICQSNGDDTETSSTTTESSHDDGDKEVEVTLGLRLCEPSATVSPRAPRGRGKIGAGSAAEPAKKSPVANVAGSASSLEWDDEEAATASEREREPRRSREGNVRNRKTNAKSSKLTESGQPGQSGSRSKSSNSAAKQSSGREKAGKEKQTLVQKRSLDKLPSLGKPVPYEAPPPPLTLWDESRASFSDVVARSDSSKPAQESAPTLPCLPPQPLAPATLGPIGSKKACASVWEGWGEPADPSPPPPPTMLPTPTPVPASASSFFMDSFTDTRAPQTQQPAVQNTMACYDRGWSEHPSSALASSSSSMLLKMIQAQAQEEQRRRIQTQEEMQRRAYHDTWSPWESLAPVPSPPSPAPVPQSLWGNDVWAPPPPPDTWAPPGLAPRPPPRLDDPANPDMDIGLDYDPFRSLSNIWAPHSSPNNFWKPPTTN